MTLSRRERRKMAENRTVGPTGPRGMTFASERGSFDKEALKRLLTYLDKYKAALIIVIICILISSVTGAVSSMFLQTLIDDYITPLLLTDNPIFTGLISALFKLACIYLLGIVATWVYSWMMASISQGTLKSIRDDMFEKMQSLPIRYRYFKTDASSITTSTYFISFYNCCSIFLNVKD